MNHSLNPSWRVFSQLRTHVYQPWRPHSLHLSGYRDSFLGLKQQKHVLDCSPPSNAEVETVLCLCSPRLCLCVMCGVTSPLWNPLIHYRVHMNFPLSLSWAIWVECAISSYFFKVRFIIIFPPMPRSCKWTLSFRISTKILYAFLFSTIWFTCRAHLVLFDVITQLHFLHSSKAVWCSLLVQQGHLKPSVSCEGCKQTNRRIFIYARW